MQSYCILIFFYFIQQKSRNFKARLMQTLTVSWCKQRSNTLGKLKGIFFFLPSNFSSNLKTNQLSSVLTVSLSKCSTDRAGVLVGAATHWLRWLIHIDRWELRSSQSGKCGRRHAFAWIPNVVKIAKILLFFSIFPYFTNKGSTW